MAQGVFVYVPRARFDDAVTTTYGYIRSDLSLLIMILVNVIHLLRFGFVIMILFQQYPRPRGNDHDQHLNVQR